MRREDHVAGPVGDAIIRVCCNIIEQLHDRLFGLLSCLGLLGADGAEGHKKFVVDHPRIIEQ